MERKERVSKMVKQVNKHGGAELSRKLVAGKKKNNRLHTHSGYTSSVGAALSVF